MNQSLIPLILINGELGSGKTTLVRRLLDQPALAGSMLIENEYASVNIDRMIVAADEHAHDSVLEISGSCICCSTGEELEQALAQLVARGWDKPVIIEATGMANSARLLQRLFLNDTFVSRFDIIRTILLIDPLETTGGLSDELSLEIKLSDTVIINKGDVADAAHVAQLAAAIKAVNPAAEVITTTRSDYELAADAASRVELALVEQAESVASLETEATMPYFVHRPSGAVDVERLVARLQSGTADMGIRRFKGFVTASDGTTRLVESTAARGSATERTVASAGENVVVLIGQGASRQAAEELGL